MHPNHRYQLSDDHGDHHHGHDDSEQSIFIQYIIISEHRPHYQYSHILANSQHDCHGHQIGHDYGH
jgi:hypothetical protein